MDTRTASIVTVLALAASAAVATGFGSSASAEPPNQGPTLTPVTTEPDFVPTTLLAPNPAATTVPDDLADQFPAPTPVVPTPTTVVARDGESHRGFEPIPDAESPAPIEIVPEFAPPPEYHAPCGTVPYNLEPVGPIQLVDMTGDGTADDRISIRRDASGTSTTHLLHLERSTGERSEALIPDLEGQDPEISFIVQLDLKVSSDVHPAPTADEVIVAYGTQHSADDVKRFFGLFGTDERGCIARYSFSSPPQGLSFAFNGSGSAGFECDLDGHLTRTSATKYGSGWNLGRSPLARHDATTVFAYAPSGVTVGGTEPPFLPADC